MHVCDPKDAPRRRGRFQVLRETGYGAVQRHVPVQVLHCDIRDVDERVVAKFQLHGIADILRFGHSRILSIGPTVNYRSFFSSSRAPAVVKVRTTVRPLAAAMTAAGGLGGRDAPTSASAAGPARSRSPYPADAAGLG